MLVLLCAAPQEPSLQDLLRRLDDDRIEAREQALEALAARGPAILPDLERAMAGATDERRIRLADAARRIRTRERLSKVMPDPVPVTLEARNRTVRDVAAALARAARTPIDASAVPEDRRISLSVRGAPLWKALESLCLAGGELSYEPRPEGVLLTPEPLAPVPRAVGDRFAVHLASLSVDAGGSLAGGDRYETTTAVFQLGWSKGTAPWRVTARLERMLDDRGGDLLRDDEPVVYTDAAAAGSLGFQAPLGAGRGPAPGAEKLSVLEAVFEVDFILRRMTLRVDDLRAGAVREGDLLGARVKASQHEAETFVVNLQLYTREGDVAEVPVSGLRLRDSTGEERAAGSLSRIEDADGLSYTATFDLPDGRAPAWISVDLPAETHTERVRVELKDVPLR